MEAVSQNGLMPMSVLNIQLRKLLQLFYADASLRRRLLLDDIRVDARKDDGGKRGTGGDFYVPFWADAKAHVAGTLNLTEQTKIRIADNKARARLYPLLRDGFLYLLNERLRWSNEPVEIFPENVHGKLAVAELAANVRLENVMFARVRGHFNRLVYPYFSEKPPLTDEGARLGIWAMSVALSEHSLDDMRIIDVLRRAAFSPTTPPLVGDEREIFLKKYQSLISEWESLKGK